MRGFTAGLAAATLLATAWMAPADACGPVCPGISAALAHRGGAAQARLSRQLPAPDGHRCTEHGTPAAASTEPANNQAKVPPCPGCGRLQAVALCGSCQAPAAAAGTLARRSFGVPRPFFASVGADHAAALPRAAADHIAGPRSARCLPPSQPALYLLFATLLI